MKNRPRSTSSSCLAIAFALMLTIGCNDQVPITAAKPSLPVRPHFVENSDDFYEGGDGYYYWDGQPPPGDQSPADIISAEAYGSPPKPGTYGYVSGHMDYVGDESNIDLVYSVDSAGHAKFSNAHASAGWEYGMLPGMRDPQPYLFSQSLQIYGICNFSLQVGGTAYARKAIPFGISINLIKFSIALTPGSITWGETSRPLEAYEDPGVSCDDDLSQSQCDNEQTTEIEYCPVDGDPANAPYPGARFASATDTRGDVGGYSSPGTYVGTQEYCVEWIDWWVSFDGGSTWHYDYGECKHWEVE
jgi:hypothetical protein